MAIHHILYKPEDTSKRFKLEIIGIITESPIYL